MFRIILGAVTALCLLITAWGSWFLVPEGHVGIETRFSKAVSQVGPGIHLKMPIIDGVKKIEVRERKNGEELSAATKNQLPIVAHVTINWTVNPEAALNLYKRYGSLEQFESRILDPKLRQAAKAALSEYNADELIRNRNSAIARIQENTVAALEGYPVTVNSPQIEDIQLPPTYMEAVLEKERAREAAVREQYNLEKQALEAQQKTQTAEAERDAAIARADGEAYRLKTEAEATAAAIELKGRAEAEAIQVVEKALAGNPLLVQYEQAKRWDGKLPTTMPPNGTVPFLNVDKD